MIVEQISPLGLYCCNNCPKTTCIRERGVGGGWGGERKQNYPGFIVERTGWWLEIAIFKVNSIQLKGADKIQIFEKKI